MRRLLPLLRCLTAQRSLSTTAARSSQSMSDALAEPGFAQFLLDARASLQHSAPESAYDLDEDDDLVEPYDRLSEAARYGKASIGHVILPSALQEAVLDVLRGKHGSPPAITDGTESDRKQVRADAEALWERQRQAAIGDPPWRKRGQPDRAPDSPRGYSQSTALAYAMGLMPQAYAATRFVLREAHRRLELGAGSVPGWQPDRIVDYGCGTGSVGWAAQEVWPELGEYLGLDAAKHMVALSARLLEPLHDPLRRSVVQAGITAPDGRKAARAASEDEARRTLAVAAFTLSELPDNAARARLVQNMWDGGAEVIILIERGTPSGFLMIAEARQRLLALGARTESADDEDVEAVPGVCSYVVAPCPHDLECPMHRQKDFCHMRTKRTSSARCAI